MFNKLLSETSCFCFHTLVVSEVAAFAALHMLLSKRVPSVSFLLWSYNYSCMLGEILQTVGERAAFIIMLIQDIVPLCFSQCWPVCVQTIRYRQRL